MNSLLEEYSAPKPKPENAAGSADVAMHFLYGALSGQGGRHVHGGKPRLGRRPMTGVETWLPPLLFPSVAER